jgi:hypothetical protein
MHSLDTKCCTPANSQFPRGAKSLYHQPLNHRIGGIGER